MRFSKMIAVAGFLFACGSTGATSNGDAGDAAASDATSDGGVCCTPDPNPGCCMRYGGFSADGQCFAACDGMPQPSDPGWKLVTDSYGCMVWTNSKSNGGAGTCGAPIIDAGSDAGSDAQTD